MSQKKKPGQLITLEGVEGAGKSLQIPKIKSFLANHGISSISTCEPGGAHELKGLRNILLSLRENPITPLSETFLLMADRAQHTSQVILPALKNGTWVISDRYVDSTLVYQGYAKGVDISLLKLLNRSVAVEADITFLFDIDPEKSLKRIREKKDRFEEEPLSFHRKVRQGYLDLAEKEAARFIVIDADLKPEIIFENITHHLLLFL